ncbi:MAG: COG2958 family protein [Rickettsiaceae bacterium]
MSLNLPSLVVEFLRQNSNQKFTAREIATWILEAYPNECKVKQNRSKATVKLLNNNAALLQQIVAEIGSQRPNIQKKNHQIKVTEGRPRKYYYTESSDGNEIQNAEHCDPTLTIPSQSVLTEHDLYPLLNEFLWSEFKVYSKRINERKSRNSYGAGGNKWLYPDLVGMEDLSQEWHREIKDCVQQYADKKTKLWSFEVKILINRSNVREAFFQTVSNSSWANFSYLVASEIEGTDTINELRILASLHGIGFIRLDAENPSESQIIIPSKEKNAIDWNTANRLAEENADFLYYIKLVRQFYQTGELRSADWDHLKG